MFLDFLRSWLEVMAEGRRGVGLNMFYMPRGLL